MMVATSWAQDRSFSAGSLRTSENGLAPRVEHPVEHPVERLTEQSVEKPLEEEGFDFLIGSKPLTAKKLYSVPEDKLVTALYKLQDPTTHGIDWRKANIHGRIIHLVGKLLRTHDPPLSSFHYECIMEAMAAPSGSALGIAALLKDMEKEGIQPTATICLKALAALSIHPDYRLREEVLDIMRERWFTVDKASQQYVLLGLLRDGQHELAYEKLSEMRDDGVVADLWVYDIFITVFGRLRFLDEMLQIFIDRKQAEAGDPSYLNVAYHVLDVCSSAYHYQGTAFAWTVTVRNGLLNPSDAMLENVLATASREGDTDLASQALSQLSERGRVHEQHYEAMVEAFATSSNLEGAIRMVRVMARSSRTVGRDHARPIYSLLLREQHLVHEASKILRSVAKDGHVPWAVVEAVVEASAQLQSSTAILDLYEDIELLTGRADHDINTIVAMLMDCEEEELKSRLITDYKNVVQDVDTSVVARQAMTAHVLTRIFLDVDEFELAINLAQVYVQQHASKKELIPWLIPLTEAAIEVEDKRIWQLMDKLREAGHQEAVDEIATIAQERHVAMVSETPEELPAEPPAGAVS